MTKQEYEKMERKLVQICRNARENGMLDDPRVAFDTIVNSNCGFQPKEGCTNQGYFPSVCGNCKHHSIQWG